MVTTVSVMKKRQIVLPKVFCEEICIHEGASLRAVTVKGSILLTPIRPPSKSEYAAIIKAAGRPLAKEPPGTVDKIKRAIRKAHAHGRRA
jgi:bifunctional DNA-binding transcriptional regulator/antitoxin component of YhaV-PrlF toxin-antitoxin module